MTAPSRYLPSIDSDGCGDDLPERPGGVYCTDCPTYPFIEHVVEHDRWHVEQAAQVDPNQSGLPGLFT